MISQTKTKKRVQSNFKFQISKNQIVENVTSFKQFFTRDNEFRNSFENIDDSHEKRRHKNSKRLKINENDDTNLFSTTKNKMRKTI